MNNDRSIIRKHVVRSLLASRWDPYLEQQNFNLTTRASYNRHGSQIDPVKLKAVKNEVGEFLSNRISIVTISVELSQNDWP